MITNLKKFIADLVQTKERRRRLKRPLLLNIIGVGFILAPFANLIFNALYFDIPLNIVLAKYDIWGIILLFVSPVVGLGILHVKKWGWYAFVIFALSVLAYNISLLLNNNLVYNWIILIHSAILLIIAGILLQKDITAPYFAETGRGFRRVKREVMRHPIRINNVLYETVDYSKLGALVLWHDCKIPLGAEVEVDLKDGKHPIKAGVVRVDGNHVGLAFRNQKFFQFYF